MALSDPFVEPGLLPSPGGEDEARRPCPMCGEMIIASAVKCRFCGEIFDPTLRRRSADPVLADKFGTQMNVLGGLWIFFGCLFLLAVIVGSSERRRKDPEEVIFVVGVIMVCWLIFGICTCLKQIWAVYAGLAFSYLFVLLSIIGLIGGAGGDSASVGGGICIMCFVIIGIVQGHRMISMSGQLSQGRRQYD
ncbi:MAG TPA: hypothetical protein VKD72_38500 [Gemmataceae bacterium]|nr:hypothetical protein [Gemmataceae bacterium]